MMRRVFRVGTLLGLLLSTNALLAAQTSQAPSVQVDTVALKQQPMSDTVSGYGVVSPDTRSLHTVSLPRPGRIASLSVSPGQVVKRGQVLLEFATGADATLAYLRAREAVDFARGELARTGQLLAQQLATRSQLAAAKKALANAEAALQAQQRIGAGRALERIAAPFDGVVTSVMAGAGQRLASGAPLLTLARGGRSRLILGIEPDQVARVHPGMAVEVTPVFDSARSLLGRVTQVFGVIDPKTQFVDVLVELQGAALMPGTKVHATVQLARKLEWVVPRSAVLKDARGAYVFQVAKGKAQRVEVTTGLTQHGMVAVHGAFDPGKPVVRLGNYELHDGMAIRGGAR
ncbi:multidrug resistance protein MdtA [mine drainage metagenome]|uniref:Multidrug resistance protein MdtA n=1 Tax=mine drainage metagenome TaxID=410659 RepID=A0A1J5RB31_9ZZZZ